MKIDFLISKMSDGGAQRVISMLANYLDEKGYVIRVISFTGQDHYPLNPGIERVRLHRQPLVKSVVFSGFFSLLSFYRKKANRPDVMSSHIDLLGYMTIPIARIFGIKIIVSEHNNHLSRYTYQERFLWNALYPLADAVTILTGFDLDYFSKKNKRVVVMPNPTSFQPNTTPLPAEKRKKQIMAIGQLNRYHHKGLDNLIDIAAALLPQFPDWTVSIVGRGEKGRDFLEKRVADTGMGDRIHFLGYRDDIRQLLGETGIYILPSRWEGLPMTLLEAMSQGAPCIAYDCVSGPADIIEDRVDGLLIPNQDKDAMLAGLKELMENPATRDRFIKKAPLALSKFSIKSVGKLWEELIGAVESGHSTN